MVYVTIADFQQEYDDSILPLLLHGQFRPFVTLYPVNAAFHCRVIIGEADVPTEFERFTQSPRDAVVCWNQDVSRAYFRIREGMLSAHRMNKAMSILMSAYLIRYWGFFLHASVVKYGDRCLLFSADSGVGKSTQARIWERVNGACIINQDKGILTKRNGSWFVSGSPWSGEDRCYHNITAPVGCILLLSRGSECRLVPVDRQTKLQWILRQLRLCVDIEKYIDEILPIISNAIQEIPIYRYECTAAEESGYYLLDSLRKVDLL